MKEYEEVCPRCEGRNCNWYMTCHCNTKGGSGNCKNCTFKVVPVCEMCLGHGKIYWIDKIMKRRKIDKIMKRRKINKIMKRRKNEP